MGINDIPTEILDLIFSCLRHEKPIEVNPHHDPLTSPQSLRNARLVCRQWNTLATKHLFRAIALMHDLDDPDFAKWKQAVRSPIVQNAAREAEIFSTRPLRGWEMELERDYQVWESWESGNWPEFVTAIQDLAELPNLRAVKILFTTGCQGSVDHYYPPSVLEPVATREYTMEYVFLALQQRKARANVTPVTSLTIENLQNFPFDYILRTECFRSLVEDITELRLLVVTETDPYMPSLDQLLEERHIFEPWLQKHLLPCFASQLTTLHLAFREPWGVAPGYFDGRGLRFPNLKSLMLTQYVIGHHNQFDWVLSQTTLEALCLEQCQIVSYLEYREGDLQPWGPLPTHDWKPVIEGRIHSFDGTWEVVLDAIRTRLSNLVEFRMGHPNTLPGHGLRNFDEIGCYLSNLRYATFRARGIPPWMPPTADGVMEFPKWSSREVNRAKETEKGDTRALKELVNAVEERARRRS
ncbi:hypothetical protein QBC41DRAFT_41003 [Cercophora samala]|uniref:F-box domain-containing protein n=1 Tax=Cercophora samala TaxID=330535 RepID=A0AA39YYH1_9PEZI|nr:hypothetical protein QBC41DRAFT_41003 [Cercophora samala]